MRPRSISEFAGQAHLVGDGRPLAHAVAGRGLHSMVLWGPPGSGKTTLARLVAGQYEAEFIALSAVLAGVKDVRAAVERAQALQGEGRRTVLFLDEVHRFNKAQQDAFLPWVEDGTLTFIGATTENPSFELNSALLSRARVYVLKALSQEALLAILRQALADAERGLGARAPALTEEQLAAIAEAADGDARRALNLLELAADLAGGDSPGDSPQTLDEATFAGLLAGGHRRFDKRGEAFYDQISALHKSVRGTDPDAALYWLARMLDGGCDPGYIARRVLRMASEDIGNADPRGLALALDAWNAYERLGSPEGELALAQAVAYLACAPKSNAVYRAWGEARADAEKLGSLPVPLHLRNAPTRLMKELGYGREYRYAHDEAGGFAAGEDYFPEEMAPRRYYEPPPRGLELKIGEKLAKLRKESATAALRRRGPPEEKKD
ncbi:replication-associated recombination protein A [Thioalkalivibrio sp. XN8]|uniref:replication-associated recombination protein A n=1 Tax=Thioalkalivibrio sp. XN8 TaxID=2712863 RepID=UPI0013ECF2E4|nr:replication-associated recombination protein A [Thioalkalivibrio sp. XN8]NGP54800.1 replication-associated recombination protein A [Thioalkalivibrio sp. XN8]